MTALDTSARPAAGVAWMVASGLSFVGVNTLVRSLGTELPAAQSAFLRFAFGVLFLAPVLPGLWRSGLPAGVGRLVIGRGVVHVAAVLFWFYAMARTPMAHVTAIGYLSPVILLVAGALLLGESLTSRRILAVGLAILGTLLVLRPGWQPLGLGHLSQLVATFCFAGSYLFARALGRHLSAGTIVTLLSLTVTVGLAPLALWVWQPVTAWQLGSLALVAAFATSGHYCMSRAFAAAPFAVTQPVIFLQLVWASLVGSLLFGETVDGWVLAGGAVIIAAISWVTWAEAQAPRAEPEV